MRMDYTVTLGRKLTKQDKKEYKDIATQALQSPDAGKQGLVYEEYHWRINSPVFSKKNRAYVVLCRGTKYRIEVRRKVRDAQGRVIVPNLRDPTHYGRVP